MINGGSEFLQPSKDLRILHVLLEIANQPDLSQHELARRVRLSSSQVNNYVKELKDRGLVDIKGNTNRTFRYFLTQEGEREKETALIAYSVDVMQLYGRVKRELAKKIQHVVREGMKTAVLFGAAETGEVVLVASKETGLKVLGVSDNDPQKHGKRFGDFTIISPLEVERLRPDGVLITSFGRMNEIFESLKFLEQKGIMVRGLASVPEPHDTVGKVLGSRGQIDDAKGGFVEQTGHL